MFMCSLAAFAQANVRVLVKNQYFEEDTFFFDIYLQCTTSDRLFLGHSDFALNFNESYFGQPLLGMVSGSTSLKNAFGDTTEFYNQSIGYKLSQTGINANRVLVYIDMPVYSTSTQFYERIAVIDQDPLTHRIGTFFLTNATNALVNPDMQWVSSGTGLKVNIVSRDSATLLTGDSLTTSTVDPVIDPEPSVQASALRVISKTNSSMTLSWARGNGNRSIVLARNTDSSMAGMPVDGLLYRTDTVFGGGARIGSSGTYAVYAGTDTTVTVTGLSALTNYTFYVLDVNGGDGSEENYNTSGVDSVTEETFDNYVVVNVKVFLQGNLSGSAMGTLLNSNNQIPLKQPYGVNLTGWNYYGDDSVAAIPNASVVDWVLLELRTGVNKGDTLSVNTKRAAFLLSDGRIVDLNGTDPVRFYEAVAGDYYIIVRHRNHLPIMSASKISLTNGSSQYDFTSGQSKAYGTNPMKEVTTGIFAMTGGDANSSRIITAADRTEIRGTLSLSNYISADTNLSGIVTAADLNVTLLNFNKTSQVPD